MSGTEEKGVYVCMATDAISPARADNYDTAVPAFVDREFVLVAEFLDTRGIKVIHGEFPPLGVQLTVQCSGGTNAAQTREDSRSVGRYATTECVWQTTNYLQFVVQK